MKEFKLGDKVIPHKPSNVHQSPEWISEMDRFQGIVCTISGFTEGGYIKLKESQSYHFHKMWLTPAKPELKDLLLI